MQEFKDLGIPEEVFNRSVAFGETVASHVLAWADEDGYKESRTMSRYTPQKGIREVVSDSAGLYGCH